jgi:hypothetical protein
MLRQPIGGFFDLEEPPPIHVLLDPLRALGSAQARIPRQPRDEVTQQPTGFGLDWVGRSVGHAESMQMFYFVLV